MYFSVSLYAFIINNYLCLFLMLEKIYGKLWPTPMQDKPMSKLLSGNTCHSVASIGKGGYIPSENCLLFPSFPQGNNQQVQISKTQWHSLCIGSQKLAYKGWWIGNDASSWVSKKIIRARVSCDVFVTELVTTTEHETWWNKTKFSFHDLLC